MMADDAKHIHDCTGPDQTCPCGYVFRVPPISFSVTVYDRDLELIDDHFNCEDVATVVAKLREIANYLEWGR